MTKATHHDDLNAIGIFQRRKIEALIIQPIYEILKRDYGEAAAKAVIEEAVNAAAIRDGEKMANHQPNESSIESFIALQPLWHANNALETETLKSSSQQFDYNVTRCRYAEMYHQLGLAEIGYLLSCNRDEKFIEGYAPHITLERTQTIMEGSAYCDFRYTDQRSSDPTDP